MPRCQQLFWLFSSLLVICTSTDAEGRRWLDKKAREPSVRSLKHGISYRVLHEGARTGAHPARDSPCVLHYEAKRIDGKVVLSTYESGRAPTMSPEQGINGMNVALQLMRPGVLEQAAWCVTQRWQEMSGRCTYHLKWLMERRASARTSGRVGRPLSD